MWGNSSRVVVCLGRNLEKIDMPVYSAKGHSEIINCIDGVGGLGIGEGAPEIVTGSRDGMATFKNWKLKAFSQTQ